MLVRRQDIFGKVGTETNLVDRFMRLKRLMACSMTRDAERCCLIRRSDPAQLEPRARKTQVPYRSVLHFCKAYAHRIYNTNMHTATLIEVSVMDRKLRQISIKNIATITRHGHTKQVCRLLRKDSTSAFNYPVRTILYAGLYVMRIKGVVNLGAPLARRP